MTNTFNLVLRTETVKPTLRATKPDIHLSQMDFYSIQTVVTAVVKFLNGVLGSTGFVRKFLCTSCICDRPAMVQPRPNAPVGCY